MPLENPELRPRKIRVLSSIRSKSQKKNSTNHASNFTELAVLRGTAKNPTSTAKPKQKSLANMADINNLSDAVYCGPTTSPNAIEQEKSSSATSLKQLKPSSLKLLSINTSSEAITKNGESLLATENIDSNSYNDIECKQLTLNDSLSSISELRNITSPSAVLTRVDIENNDKPPSTDVSTVNGSIGSEVSAKRVNRQTSHPNGENVIFQNSYSSERQKINSDTELLVKDKCSPESKALKEIKVKRSSVPPSVPPRKFKQTQRQSSSVIDSSNMHNNQLSENINASTKEKTLDSNNKRKNELVNNCLKSDSTTNNCISISSIDSCKHTTKSVGEKLSENVVDFPCDASEQHPLLNLGSDRS